MATKTDDASTGARARLAALVAHRWAALIGAWLVFLPVYGALRESLGGSARVLLIGAVIATGWYRGAWVGALTGLVIVPLSAVLHMVLTGGSLAVPDWMTADATAGTLGAILAGGVVGYVRELNLRLTADVAERQRSEDDLRARFARVTTAWRS